MIQSMYYVQNCFWFQYCGICRSHGCLPARSFDLRFPVRSILEALIMFGWPLVDSGLFFGRRSSHYRSQRALCSRIATFCFYQFWYPFAKFKCESTWNFNPLFHFVDHISRKQGTAGSRYIVHLYFFFSFRRQNVFLWNDIDLYLLGAFLCRSPELSRKSLRKRLKSSGKWQALRVPVWKWPLVLNSVCNSWLTWDSRLSNAHRRLERLSFAFTH